MIKKSLLLLLLSISIVNAGKRDREHLKRSITEFLETKQIQYKCEAEKLTAISIDYFSKIINTIELNESLQQHHKSAALISLKVQLQQVATELEGYSPFYKLEKMDAILKSIEDYLS